MARSAAPSIIRRIRSRLLPTWIVTSLLVIGLMHVGVERLLQYLVARQLQHDADTLIANLVVDEQQNFDFLVQPPIYQRALSGHYFVLVMENGQQIRSRSLWDQNWQPDALQSQQQLGDRIQRRTSDKWQSLGLAVQVDQLRATLWVAEDVSELNHLAAALELVLAIFALFTGSLALFWQSRSLKRSFLPLVQLTEEFSAWRHGKAISLNQDLPEELVPFVQALREQLDHSAQVIQRSRTSVADLSHELKRPLFRLNQICLDTTYPKELRAELSILTQEIQRRIDSELRRARIAGTPVAGAHFEPEQDVKPLKYMLHKLHGEHISLDLNFNAETYIIERDDFLEVLGNLLDNAMRFSNSRVILRWEKNKQGYRLQVDDDGSGISDKDQMKLLKRGQRADEREADAHQGFGLSIVEAIVDSYGGTIKLESSPLGGLRVTIHIPDIPKLRSSL